MMPEKELIPIEDVILMLGARADEFPSDAAYADYLGVTRSFVSLVLRGRRYPTVSLLDDIGVARGARGRYEYWKVPQKGNEDEAQD